MQGDTQALLARQALVAAPGRSLVEGEIRLLIERLHGTATHTPFGSGVVRERDPGELLPRERGAKDRALLDYVTTVAQVRGGGGGGDACCLACSGLV